MIRGDTSESGIINILTGPGLYGVMIEGAIYLRCNNNDAPSAAI